MNNTTESTMNPVEMACCSSDKAFPYELSSSDLSEESLSSLSSRPSSSSSSYAAYATAATERFDPPENLSKWRKTCDFFKTTGKILKHSIQNISHKVCPCVVGPQTYTISEPSSEAFVSPSSEQSYINWGSTLWDFKALYQMELGENFKCHLGAIEGFRRSDGQKVGIKPMNKLQRRETPESCEETESLYKEELLPPASDHIARVLEVFAMQDFDMMIVETLPSYITLKDFLKQKKGKLTEADVKAIMLQVFKALHDSWERGLVLNVNLEGVAIDPNTLHVKVVDFRFPHQDAELPGIRGDKQTSEEWMKERSKLQGTDNIFRVMQALVKNIRRPSKECTDLLQRLKTYRGLWLLRTLNGVFTDPWLVSIALRMKRDGENCSSFR